MVAEIEGAEALGPHGRRSSSGRRWALAAVCVALFGVVGACSRERASSKGSDYNVLLVTLDTTRADYLGCYGRADVRTPALDGLATRGALFESAYSTAVMTLPSHASILTGLLPPEHGVRANGNYQLSPAASTLAEMLGAAGWRTGAAVGSFVLDSMFGLDQGFGAYDDELAPPGTSDLSHAERSATGVTDAALKFLAAEPAGRWFLWTHYFDPHQPYQAPAAFTQAFPGRPYEAELAYVDAELGRLLEALRARGEAERTLVVVVADHGEGFRDHGEATHAVFLYDETARVPLIVAAPGLVSGPKRIQAVVRTTDIVPTVLDLLGLPEREGLNGRSLRPLLQDEHADLELAAYSEAPRALLGFGWSPIAALREGRWKYIEAPLSELYDLAADARERSNLAAAQPEVAARLRAELVRVHDAAVQAGRGSLSLQSSPEIQTKLQALGYAAGDEKASKSLLDSDPKILLQGGARGLVDPKQRIEVIDKVNEIFVAFSSGDFERAVVLCDGLLATDPDIAAARQYRADALRTLGRLEEALAEYDRILARDPYDVDALMNSGWVRLNQQRVHEAQSDFELALTLIPDHPYALASLASVKIAQGDDAAALALCQKVLSKDPHHRQCLASVADIHLRRGEVAEAKATYAKVAELDPQDLSTHLMLGWLQFTAGEHDAALATLAQVESIHPTRPEAAFARGDVYLALTRPDDAEAAYREGVRRAPNLAQGYHGLGLAAEARGQLELAEQRYREALEVDPTYALSIEALKRIEALEATAGQAGAAPGGKD